VDKTASSRLSEYALITRRGSEVFWAQAKKWFLVAAVVGLAAGLFVTGLDYAVGWIWSQTVPRISPITVVVFPTVGLLLSGLALQYLTVNPTTQGTEEVIEVYHERSGVFRFRSFPGKILAALATLGFGGSAGLEGPSIYAGGAIGAYMLRKTRNIMGFTDEEVRTLMLAGAAAGVSAIFKAPLTGIVFALEVPYRDDITRQALIPSLIASVTSYLVLIQFMGVEPLFHVTERYSHFGPDYLYAIVLGLVVGLLARLFIFSFHYFHEKVSEIPIPLWGRTGLGGLATGLFGLASLMIFSEPLALGVGYETVSDMIAGAIPADQAVALLLLKAGATVATLACGAAGGIFIPMIFLGANAGVILRGILPGASGPLLPVIGMSAFLAAGYNTPIAAAVFVAETTGGAGYIIPGLIAAAVSFSIAGRVSVSENQRWRRETDVDRLMKLRVRDIMTREVDTVSARCSVEEFVTDRLVHMLHKSLPVVDLDGSLVGMIALGDIKEVPREEWAAIEIAEVMAHDLLTATPNTYVGDLVSEMADREIDRVPVVGAEDPGHLLGIVSSTDVLALDDVSADWRRRRKQRERARRYVSR
jgi:CIC family chloride channel protein